MICKHVDPGDKGNGVWCDDCGAYRDHCSDEWELPRLTRSPQSDGMVADVSKYHMTAKEEDTMANKIYIEGFNNALKLCEAEIESSVPAVKALSKEEIFGAVARGWCSKRNKKKFMDVDLAVDIANEIFRAQEKINEKV